MLKKMMVIVAAVPLSKIRLVPQPIGKKIMNLSRLLAEYNAAKGPVRVGLIGAGKFGSMILAQAKHIKGYHIVGVADLDISKAKASFARVHWAATCPWAITPPKPHLLNGRALERLTSFGLPRLSGLPSPAGPQILKANLFL